MTGRPPIPIAQKRLQGDTRQRGANKHADSLAGAFEARPGRPPLPECFRFRATPAISGERPTAATERKRLDTERRVRLSTARKHWLYLADQLESEKKLTMLDEGMLTGLALDYALMVEAGRDGDVGAFTKLKQRYMQAADRMGLNASARARLPGSGGKSNEVQSAMSGFLKRRDTA